MTVRVKITDKDNTVKEIEIDIEDKELSNILSIMLKENSNTIIDIMEKYEERKHRNYIENPLYL